MSALQLELDAPIIQVLNTADVILDVNVKEEHKRMPRIKVDPDCDDELEIVDLTEDIDEVILTELPTFRWMEKLETRVNEMWVTVDKDDRDRTLNPNQETIEIISDDEGEPAKERENNDLNSVDSGCLTSDAEDVILQKANATPVSSRPNLTSKDSNFDQVHGERILIF